MFIIETVAVQLCNSRSMCLSATGESVVGEFAPSNATSWLRKNLQVFLVGMMPGFLYYLGLVSYSTIENIKQTTAHFRPTELSSHQPDYTKIKDTKPENLFLATRTINYR